MTIIEATHVLIDWFQNNDSFNMETDFKKLLPNHISDTPESDICAINLALIELKDNSFVKDLEYKNNTYYILVNKLHNIPQKVELTAPTIGIISSILTETSKKINKDIDFNPLNICEKDILLALSILNDVASEEKQLK